MLLPLHDENPLRHIRFGYWTALFIAACVLVFAYQALLPEGEGMRFVYAYGAIPSVVFGQSMLPAELASVPPWLSLVTSMFLHGSFMHLAGNMLFLWVLGDNVEDALGHVRFVVFYLLCGIAAALSHALVEPASQVPMIGASGAISGVIGAYLVLHPTAPIRTLVFNMIVSLPAFVVLGLWIVFQFANAAIASPGEAGIAWWAHIGGFFAGVALIFVMRYRDVPLFDRPPRRRY
jgi:membrane associated rhomboid family serine protease